MRIRLESQRRKREKEYRAINNTLKTALVQVYLEKSKKKVDNLDFVCKFFGIPISTFMELLRRNELTENLNVHLLNVKSINLKDYLDEPNSESPVGKNDNASIISADPLR